MVNSSQTHLPTTCAWLQISGISVFNRSRSARVFNLLASSAFMVTLFLPSTCTNRLLLVWLLSLEARTALCFSGKAEPPYGGEKWLPLKEGSRWSIILREQDGRCRPVCFRDEPKPCPVRGLVGGDNPPALCQCSVVGRTVVVR